ncbi:hypothetical protein PYH37_003500 [Sinorhizobium numidicum]|uniref:Uncharacterized protein n=1 Tax=Sinorhizobium numidicum TaxID=680248 RepID=A0ABY8CTL4_9HYPH|nr:hypothetical protein [Sinorhizobium numidicum]WEX78599.1 hypothetical protein PYH37_003500 [Sinorhizobium numidicum]WEX81996.1 hypothetical protein PYH38_004213 [Sinorhizobium numidicum]
MTDHRPQPHCPSMAVEASTPGITKCFQAQSKKQLIAAASIGARGEIRERFLAKYLAALIFVD